MKKAIAASCFMLLFASSAFAQSSATVGAGTAVDQTPATMAPATTVTPTAPATTWSSQRSTRFNITAPHTGISRSMGPMSNMAPATSATAMTSATGMGASTSASAPATVSSVSHSQCNGKGCPGGACHAATVAPSAPAAPGTTSPTPAAK